MDPKWFYAKRRTKYGPIPKDELQELAQSGFLAPSDMVLQEGTPLWLPAQQLSWLFPQNSPVPPPLPASHAVAIVPARSLPPAPPPAEPVPIDALPVMEAIPVEIETPAAVDQASTDRQAGGPLRFLGGAFVGVWPYSIAWLRYRAAKRRLLRRERELLAAKSTFGRKIFDSGLSSETMFKRIDHLQKLIQDRLKDEAPTAATKAQQDVMFAAIADPFMDNNELPGGIRAEQRAAQDAVVALEEERQSHAAIRTQFKSRSGYGKGQLIAGYSFYATLAIALTLIVFWPRGSHPDGSNLLAADRRIDPKDKTEKTTEPKDDTKGDKKDTPRREALKELNARLSPAVPWIVNSGRGSTGSGFLVEKSGKLVVVTNRHVVEGAFSGLDVHFFPDIRRDDKFTIPKERTRVIAIHRACDLALIDVSADAARLRDLHITPVTLAAPDHIADVGEELFVIGHPGGDGGSGGVLERTLTKGIVSAVRRTDKRFGGSFIQTDAAINGGNSGGPAFDMDGRVIGVATWKMLADPSKRTLTALNFCLETPFVHELIDRPDASMAPPDITAILSPKKTGPSAEGIAVFKDRLKILESKGYRFATGRPESSVIPFRLGANRDVTDRVMIDAGKEMVVFAVCEGSKDVMMSIVNSTGMVVAKDDHVGPDPIVTFRAATRAEFTTVIQNMTAVESECVLVYMAK